MQKLKLKIEKPCHENWDEMTPNEQGRFCSHCTKNVIDFSKKSNEEVLSFFLNRQKSEHLCIRINQEQEEGIVINRSRIHFPNFVRQFAVATLIGFSIAGTPIAVNGQNVVKGVEADRTAPNLIDRIITIEVPPTFKTIEIQRVKTPAKVIIHEIPAEYETITKRKLVKKGGGFPEWHEIECLAPESEITIEIKLLKQKLQEKGYYTGEIDNVLNEDVKVALLNFKKDNRLLPAFELDDDTMYLLGI